MKTTIKINGIKYSWEQVYKISGLCAIKLQEETT